MLKANDKVDKYENVQIPEAPPSNVQAEQSLLGGLLIANDAFDQIQGIVEPDDFFEPLHGQIYDVLSRLLQAGRKVTPVTLKSFFENVEPIERDLTVAQYLGRLAVNATSVRNLPEYAQTIRDLSVRRSIMLIGDNMTALCQGAPPDYPASAILDECESDLFALSEKRDAATLDTFNAATTKALEVIKSAYENPDGTGLKTGFFDLDDALGGIGSTDLVIVAARPSMGKTAFATNIAEHMARVGMDEVNGDGEVTRVALPVLFFSLEMSSEQLAMRIIAEKARVSSSDARSGKINEGEFLRIAEASRDLEDLPLYIEREGGISIANMTARARRYKRQHGIRAVFVDYLQLMRGTSRGGFGINRTQELTEITTGLKAMAKELEVPVVALSQLSRDVEKRGDKRPMLADLRDSGSIEQDADIVLFLFREEYYVERRKPSESDAAALMEWQEEMNKVHGRAEVIIGKQRHGSCSNIPLAFDARLTKFGTLAKGYAGGGSRAS